MVEREWDDPNWSIGDTLTAQQFADHVTEGHFPSDELQFTITTDGNPAFVDPQNGDAEILTYDRSAQTWTLNTLNATTEVTSPSVTADALEADSATFNQDITDPEGNTVTSLSDPVRVTEEASTFAESDVTVATNNTVVNAGSIQLTSALVDGFEDGDINIETTAWTGWTGDTGSFSAQQSTVITGSFSGDLSSSAEFVEVTATRSSNTTNDISISVNISTDVGSANDYTRLTLSDSSGTGIFQIDFNDNNGSIETTSQTIRSSWTAGTNYDIEFVWDFANDQSDIIINGVNEGTFNFLNSVNGFAQIDIGNRTIDSGATRSVFVDDLQSGQNAGSGDALVGFDSGVPADIDSWDLATFQRTLDGETVTIDVEDSNGNVLKSDISKDTDISDISTSTDVQLRANLSRNDTANNPTVDYLARRFTR